MNEQYKSGFVTLIGRPNVGKSTLFNKLVGQRLSIVDDKPGVTRDRIYSRCEWLGKEFMLIDTGVLTDIVGITGIAVMTLLQRKGVRQRAA